jgi:hypothetical protein
MTDHEGDEEPDIDISMYLEIMDELNAELEGVHDEEERAAILERYGLGGLTGDIMDMSKLPPGWDGDPYLLTPSDFPPDPGDDREADDGPGTD